MSKLQIPFKNGEMLGYSYFPDEWRDNYEFEDTLECIDFGRGRSSVKMYFKDEDSKNYEMFITDFVKLFQTANIVDGKVSGMWTFVKRGANYGVKFVK